MGQHATKQRRQRRTLQLKEEAEAEILGKTPEDMREFYSSEGSASAARSPSALSCAQQRTQSSSGSAGGRAELSSEGSCAQCADAAQWLGPAHAKKPSLGPSVGPDAAAERQRRDGAEKEKKRRNRGPKRHKGGRRAKRAAAQLGSPLESLPWRPMSALADALGPDDTLALRLVSKRLRDAVDDLSRYLCPSNPCPAALAAALEHRSKHHRWEAVCGRPAEPSSLGVIPKASSSRHCRLHGEWNTLSKDPARPAPWVSASGPAPRSECLEYKLPCAHCALHAVLVELPRGLRRRHRPAGVVVHVGERSGGPWSFSSSMQRLGDAEDADAVLVKVPQGSCPMGGVVAVVLFVERYAAECTVAVDSVRLWFSQGPQCNRQASYDDDAHESALLRCSPECCPGWPGLCSSD
eukprot:m51a1_g2938 hypothetical protein (408) ;mRNA; f:593114-594730